MREITTHKVNGCNEALAVHATDGPGPGGASHEYRVQLNGANYLMVNFQNGPIAEVGTNGVTHEALLAIVADRLEGFQTGKFACADNAEALGHLRKAMEVLHRRTKARVERGGDSTSV